MEKVQDDILQKDRSSRACISTGYRLYMSNFKRIFRYSWFAAIIFALFTSIGGTLTLLHPELALFVLPLLVAIEALFASYAFAVLKQHQETGSIGWAPRWASFNARIFVRTLKAWLCTLLISVVLGVVLSLIIVAATKYLSTYTAIAFILLSSLTLLALSLPLVYTNMRYILTDGIGYWRNLHDRYGIGLRRWGFIFLVVFFTALVSSVCAVITSLPSIILSLAGNEASTGFFSGDPYNMPSYIGTLSAVVFLLIGFIQAYIMLSVLFPTYYMYGSIDTHEKEKKKFNTESL